MNWEPEIYRNQWILISPNNSNELPGQVPDVPCGYCSINHSQPLSQKSPVKKLQGKNITGFKNRQHQICLETPAPTYWYSGRVCSSSLKRSLILPPWKIAENTYSTLTLWSSVNGSQMVMLESILSLLVRTLWTVAHQAPLSMEFYRQEYWRG